MDKAKAAVGSFLNRDGKHDTTVHETVNPAVTNENVTRTQHENVTKAVDREVHQDHHHTSVQPIQHREVLPEQHTHQMAGVEHREIKHGNDDHVKQRLAAEAAQFKNTRTVGETQHSTSANPTVAGEHVHHHVHETIQPVIQKETVQGNVVHTTVPVHEVHQNEAKHHTASQLPAVTMDEFKKQGGHLSGRDERTDAFSGEPRSVGGTLGGHGASGSTSLTQADGSRGTTGTHGTHGTHGTTGTTGTSGVHSSTDDYNNSGHHSTGATGTGAAIGNAGGVGATGGHGTAAHNTSSSSTGKPSLMDKLNPKKDADGDGKAGFMK